MLKVADVLDSSRRDAREIDDLTINALEELRRQWCEDHEVRIKTRTV